MVSRGGARTAGTTEGRGREPRATGRSARKRQAILDAAIEAFVSTGYDAVSMDDVARAAAVSKPTIYNHFGDKESLFRTALRDVIDATEASTHDVVAELADTQDLRRDLQAFARQHLRELVEPDLVRMRRRVIAEAERFPDLAADWYEHGPAAAARAFAAVFAVLDRRGLLRVDDPLRAGDQFNWLVLSPLNRAMFLAHEPLSPAELDRAADEAVDLFLAAHAPR